MTHSSLSLRSRLVQKGSPFELQSATIGGVDCQVFPRGPQTLQDLYRRTRTFSHKTFVVWSGRRLRYADVFQQAADVRRAIVAVAGGRARVGLYLGSGPDWIAAFIASTAAGGGAVLIAADAPAAPAREALRSAECDLVLVDDGRARELRRAGCDVPFWVVSGAGADGHSRESGSAPAPLGWLEDAPPPAPEDLALIAFTSGTTGRPKGVELTHRNLVTGLMNMMLGGALQAASARALQGTSRPAAPGLPPCSLVLAPLSHVGGYAQILLACHIAGALVLMPSWDAETCVSLVEIEKVRAIVGASPTQITELLARARAGRELASLSSIVVNGQRLPGQTIAELSRVLPRVQIGAGYGLTETCGTVASISGAPVLEQPSACGPVLPSVQLRITDDSGEPVAAGEVGCIWLRGAMTFRGYCAWPEATRAALREGWFRTGDLGYLDPAGNLCLAGRVEDRVAAPDGLSFSFEVEAMVLDQRWVREAAALPESDGRVTVAVVVGDGSSGSPSEARAQLLSALSARGVEARIIFVDALPRTASGKVDRKRLRATCERTPPPAQMPAPRGPEAIQTRDLERDPHANPALIPQ